MTANSTAVGKQAEIAASVYLEMRGFKVLERNWRRPRCEIDIIAQKDGVIHFVEVKYRKSAEQGRGLEAITAGKLKQMHYAAQTWVEETKWQGEYVLSAVELEGAGFSVIGFIENVL